jgi:hypothetical protein
MFGVYLMRQAMKELSCPPAKKIEPYAFISITTHLLTLVFFLVGGPGNF